MYYESVFIFSGQLTEKAANDKFIEFKSVIEKSGAKILRNEFWGLRELAYKIKKNSRGYYFMINTDCKANILNDFHSIVKRDDSLLRFLNIKIKSVINEDSPLIEKNKKKYDYEKKSI